MVVPTSAYKGGNQNRQAIPLRRRPGHSSSPSTNFARKAPPGFSNPLFCVAMLVVALLFAYLLTIVFVARLHLIGNESLRTDNKASSLLQPSSGSKRDKVEDPSQGAQGAVKRGENRKEKKARNPFYKERTDHPFGHGVQPDVLIPHQGDAPLAIKEDPPLEAHPTPDYVLKAYVESIDFEEWKVRPLPIRAHAQASQLKEVSYPRLNSCTRMPQQFPLDDPPTDEDTFLPWIHDVFPTADGKYIQFVAQNKRRCKTGAKEKEIFQSMAPQAALFQHVSVKRVANASQIQSGPRYRLVPYDQADPDGLTTRFICRFKPSMEETLSVHNFDYDWISFRKRYRVSFNEVEGGIKQIHTSQLLFRCPLPDHLQEIVRTGSSVENDWASLFVDLIPIRTPPRYGIPHQYLQPRYREFQEKDSKQSFDPVAAWGDQHILPRIEDSGRWENIPICKPSLMTFEGQSAKDLASPSQPVKKKHRLVSCLWAAAGYATRGNRFAINDGQRRLMEWITYNKLIGFDHFYVYDNTGAFRNDTSLKPIADLFPDDVTYIPWPAKVCNNRPNNVDSPGERSSQYAAESSCLLRFGPHTDWIGQFDIDEYLVPMGDFTTASQLLNKLEREDTRIISFSSWRAWPRWAFIDEPVKITDSEICWHNEPCFHLTIPMKHTMLQAYNCDRQKPGEKTEAMPAEKQLYRSDYVLQHFVHYSAVTELSVLNKTEYLAQGYQWYRRGFPDKRQRFADERKEGLMIHTKSVAHQDTSGWERMCHINNTKLPRRKQGLCRLGVPWPEPLPPGSMNATNDGWAFNCFVNPKVETYLVPKLQKNLEKFANFFDPPQQDVVAEAR